MILKCLFYGFMPLTFRRALGFQVDRILKENNCQIDYLYTELKAIHPK